MYKHFKKSQEEASAETDRLLTRSYTNLSVASLHHGIPEETESDVEVVDDDDEDDDDDDPCDPETLAIVEESWEIVDAQCVKYGRDRRYPKCKDDGDWKTVRIFVSSTFTDFFCEREVLVKKVFPELREWCRKRRLYLIDCDMRWGVPKDTTTADTIAACLEELDRCLDETGGEPFFLNLMGERYGWIPSVEDIPEELRAKYSWVPNTSITFMEVLHGAYRMRNPNALFMVRDGDIIPDIPEGHLARFKDTDQLSVQHLKLLKSWLQARFPMQVLGYTCQVEGLIPKHGRDYIQKEISSQDEVNITHLERFSEQVLEFFKTAINKFYPGREEQTTQDSLVLQENGAQRQMMEEAASSLIGRQREAQTLLDFATGSTDCLQSGETKNQPFARVGVGHNRQEASPRTQRSTFLQSNLQPPIRLKAVVVIRQPMIDKLLSSRSASPPTTQTTEPSPGRIIAYYQCWHILPEIGDPKYWSSLTTGSQLLYVQGEQGSGKTTLLAWLTQQALKKGSRVFYHFCGGTRYSHSAEVLLQRLVAFLKDNYTTDFLNSLREKGESDLKDLLREELQKLTNKGGNAHTVIILDALDQLETNDTVAHLRWLPPCFPVSVQCVASSWQHPPTVSRLTEHPHYSLVLADLGGNDAQLIMEKFLNRFNKKLDGDQLEPILSSVCSSNPLWLYFICEELRVYGDFRSLTKHIHDVTTSPAAMLEAILKRLIADDDTGYMEKTLCLISCTYSVMTSQSLQCMLGDVGAKEALPSLTWAKIRRALQAFLRIANYNDQVDFAHNSIKQTVYKLLITSPADRQRYLTLLADYIEYWSDDHSLRTQDLPYYLKEAQLKKRLVHFIREMPESRHIPTFMRSKWLSSYRCRTLADPVLPQVAQMLICQFCKMSKAKYHPSPFHRNEDMCVVCGNHVFNHMATSTGHLCSFHGIKHARGLPMCSLCGKMADKKSAVPAKLCLHCGFGNYGKQCALLTI